MERTGQGRMSARLLSGGEWMMDAEVDDGRMQVQVQAVAIWPTRFMQMSRALQRDYSAFCCPRQAPGSDITESTTEKSRITCR